MLVKFNMTQNNFRTVVIKLFSQIPDQFRKFCMK